MTNGDRLTVEAVLTAFDEHLDRTRGVCPEVRHNYARFVRAFLESLFGDGEVDLGRVCTRDVVDFVVASTHRYRPATVQLVATSLRSFFRFARASGLRTDQLEHAVPTVPRRRGDLPRHLDTTRFAALLASLDASCPQGLRDRAIILCVARLGLRASEVARLRLEDIDWRNATVHVATERYCRCQPTWGARWPATCSTGARTRRPARCSSCIVSMLGRRSIGRSSVTPWTGRCGTPGSMRRCAGRTCCGTRWPPICSGTGRA